MIGTDLELPPRPDEVEVSVFGPGYGECIVLHVTNGQWVVIDSCTAAGSGPVALEYLKLLNIDVATQVRLVLATHYHDDHIGGLGELFRRCKTARFACSMAIQSDEWSTLMELYRNYLIAGGSGVDELRRVTQELKARAAENEVVTPLFCIAGRDLSDQILQLPASLMCLSPSDAAVGAMHARIRERLLPRAKRRRLSVPSLENNDGSIVLSVRIGSASVLLGADLEERNRLGLGWQVILDDWSAGAAFFDGFKIPHHGSQTGYHPQVWSRCVINGGWAVVTPYNRQRVPLPTASDRARILALTPAAFITSPPGWAKFRHADRTVQKTAEEVTLQIAPERPRHGHVRLRKLASADSLWGVELFGQAGRLEDVRNAA